MTSKSLAPRVELSPVDVALYLDPARPTDPAHIMPLRHMTAGFYQFSRAILRDALAVFDTPTHWRTYRAVAVDLSLLVERTHRWLDGHFRHILDSKRLTWPVKLALVCEIYRAHLPTHKGE